jgi:hypothetical protein
MPDRDRLLALTVSDTNLMSSPRFLLTLIDRIVSARFPKRSIVVAGYELY